MPPPRKHLYAEGDRIGLLTVKSVELRERPDGRNRRVLVTVCDCGNEREVLPHNAASGDTRSCGCLHRRRAAEANTTHGATTGRKREPLYYVWRGMRSRCYDAKARNYRWYGAKGITIEWSGFEEFRAWAESSGYAPGLELDRFDSTKSYGPLNCRWISKAENVARAHLRLPVEVEAAVLAEMQHTGRSYFAVIEDAVRNHLLVAQESAPLRVVEGR